MTQENDVAMNYTNASTTLKDGTDKVTNPDASAVILSVVMPIVFLLFFIVYTVWSMERDTRPEKNEDTTKDETPKKLSIKPIQMTRTNTSTNAQPLKIEQKSEEPPV